MPRSRHRGDAASEHAEAIFRALMQARPAGLHMPQLMRATELTRSQVHSGMAMMRDTIVWADLAYAGKLVDWAKTFLHLTIKTVNRPKGAQGFVILPRRWVVERSLAWLLHARRSVRDYEARPEHSEAMLTLASITLMTRRLTRRPVYPNAAKPHVAQAVAAA